MRFPPLDSSEDFIGEVVSVFLYLLQFPSYDVINNVIMSDADCTPGREPRSVAASLYFVFHQDNVLFQHEYSSFCCNGIKCPVKVPKFPACSLISSVYSKREAKFFDVIYCHIYSAQLAGTTSRQWHNLRLDKMTPLCSVETWRQDTRCIAQTRHCLLLSIQTTTPYRKCRVYTSC